MDQFSSQLRNIRLSRGMTIEQLEKNNNSLHWDEDIAYKIDDNFQVSFQNEVCIVEEGFPKPVIQLEFLASIPWVLNKECTY